MGLPEVLADIKSYYENEIKPYVSESYLLAWCNMSNLNLGLIYEYQDEIKEYHNGPTFVSAAVLLEWHLRKDKDVIPITRAFETFLAQVSLSVKTENKF